MHHWLFLPDDPLCHTLPVPHTVHLCRPASLQIRACPQVRHYLLLGPTDSSTCGDVWATWGYNQSDAEADLSFQSSGQAPYQCEGFSRHDLTQISQCQLCRFDSEEARGFSHTVAFSRNCVLAAPHSCTEPDLRGCDQSCASDTFRLERMKVNAEAERLEAAKVKAAEVAIRAKAEAEVERVKATNEADRLEAEARVVAATQVMSEVERSNANSTCRLSAIQGTMSRRAMVDEVGEGHTRHPVGVVGGGCWRLLSVVDELARTNKDDVRAKRIVEENEQYASALLQHNGQVKYL